ncbi:MAG: TIGR03663 family protein [Phycisphaerae bacterium]|jgi:uncharacterized protein (TIGR03663 family)|nr:TIGR03663 family protein [Phycisphaerae bacterium]MCZ2401220.1 TIGR03663 family protein [Phycisphaerae bacterium]
MAPRTFALALILCVALAAALRLPQLSLRPMHGDEAVHAVKCWELYATGRYAYDPVEFHGPTLYYATLPILRLSAARDFASTTATTYRLAPAVAGVGLVLLAWLLADGVGRSAALWAGLLTAVSPALVYYSRYYIQETLLVFFAALAIGCGWRYGLSRRAGWAIATGAALGLMHATKETAIIAWGCMAAGLAAAWFPLRSRAQACPARLRDGGLALGAAVLTSVLLFSAMFSNARGPLDSLRAYGVYVSRAGGGGAAGDHTHPWDAYLRWFGYWQSGRGPVFSEAGVLLLALVGIAAAARGVEPDPRRRALARFLAVYGCLMPVVYSALPYKTPWSFIGAWHGLILLAGLGAARLTARAADIAGARAGRDRLSRAGLARAVPGGAALVACALVAWNLAVQAQRASTRFAADPRNPYVYAHPLHGVERMLAWIERLAAVSPEGRDTTIQVIGENPWPLPWYLRGFARVGYWDDSPERLDAPIIIACNAGEHLGVRLGDAYQASHYGLRPDAILTVYCERSLYERFARAAATAASEPATRVVDEP